MSGSVVWRLICSFRYCIFWACKIFLGRVSRDKNLRINIFILKLGLLLALCRCLRSLSDGHNHHCPPRQRWNGSWKLKWKSFTFSAKEYLGFLKNSNNARQLISGQGCAVVLYFAIFPRQSTSSGSPAPLVSGASSRSHYSYLSYLCCDICFLILYIFENMSRTFAFWYFAGSVERSRPARHPSILCLLCHGGAQGHPGPNF